MICASQEISLSWSFSKSQNYSKDKYREMKQWPNHCSYLHFATLFLNYLGQVLVTAAQRDEWGTSVNVAAISAVTDDCSNGNICVMSLNYTFKGRQAGQWNNMNNMIAGGKSGICPSTSSHIEQGSLIMLKQLFDLEAAIKGFPYSSIITYSSAKQWYQQQVVTITAEH